MADIAPAGRDWVYTIHEAPKSRGDLIIYSLQWVVTMFYAVVWGYAIVGTELGFNPSQMASYMSSVVLTIGLSTLTQVWLGHKMAMVSGPNIIPSLAIIAAVTAGGIDYAKQAILAQAIASIAIIILALSGATGFIKKIWSPLILGAMVMVVGLSVSKQGLILLANEGFGWQFFVGTLLALAGLIVAIRSKDIWGTLPPLFIIGIGYLVFMLAGDFDWQLVRDPNLFVVPNFFPYGFQMPPLDLIAIMIVVNLAASLNLFGNLAGYSDIIGQKLEDKQVSRSFLIFGFIETALAGVLGVPATVAYGENLGIVLLTRVASRTFIMIASAIFIVFAFIGPVGGLMAAMPGPVAGAVLLGIASTVIGIGAHMMSTAPAFGTREQSLVGFSVFLSIGLFLLPAEAWDRVPNLLTTIFSNPVISVILFVMLFEQVILRKKEENRPPLATPRSETWKKIS